MHRTELDPATGRTVTYKDYAKQTITPEEEAAFFDRLDEMMARREASVKALDEKIAQEKYPFKPTITSKLRKKGNQSDESSSEEEEEEGGSGAVQAFLRRYREDLDERRGKYPGEHVDVYVCICVFVIFSSAEYELVCSPGIFYPHGGYSSPCWFNCSAFIAINILWFTK